jgi:hypothetical protein
MTHKSSETGASTAPVSQFARTGGAHVDLLVAEDQRDPVIAEIPPMNGKPPMYTSGLGDVDTGQSPFLNE